MSVKILPDWNYYLVWLFPLGKYQVMIWCGEYDVLGSLGQDGRDHKKAARFILRVCDVGDACRGMFVRVCTRLICLKDRPFLSFHY